MGNEISTAGGAVATAVTGTVSAVTFGQFKMVNNATAECAKFTADKASKTIVRHVGETTVKATATGVSAVAVGLTLGLASILMR